MLLSFHLDFKQSMLLARGESQFCDLREQNVGYYSEGIDVHFDMWKHAPIGHNWNLILALVSSTPTP